MGALLAAVGGRDEGAVAQGAGAVGIGDHDVPGLAELHDRPVLHIGVHLHLVGGDRAGAKQLVCRRHMGDVEVGDADFCGHPGVERLRELVHIDGQGDLVMGRRPVQ